MKSRIPQETGKRSSLLWLELRAEKGTETIRAKKQALYPFRLIHSEMCAIILSTKKE